MVAKSGDGPTVADALAQASQEDRVNKRGNQKKLFTEEKTLIAINVCWAETWDLAMASYPPPPLSESPQLQDKRVIIRSLDHPFSIFSELTDDVKKQGTALILPPSTHHL